MNTVTIYKLTWGSDRQLQEEVRFFKVIHYPDVVVRFSERVVELDQDPTVHGAYVHLVQLPSIGIPNEIHHCAWTKCSNERPTEDGFLTETEAHQPWIAKT